MNHLKLLLLLLLFARVAASQNLRVSAGAGFPDFFHAGVAYDLSGSNEIGVQFGTAFFGTKLLTSTIEHRLYFQQSKKEGNPNSWFFSQRCTYYYERSDLYNWHNVMLGLSIGRNHYLSRNFGFSWDIGAFCQLMQKQYRNTDGAEVGDESSPLPTVLPNLRLQIFRKF